MSVHHARTLAAAALVGLSAGCGRSEPQQQALPSARPAAAAPQMAALPFDPQRVEIVDHWSGEGPGPVDFAWRLDRQGTTYTFSGTGTLVQPGATAGPLPVTIPDPEMLAFLRTLAAAPRSPGAYTPRIVHTDDYPEITIRLHTATGVTEFYSASQGEDHVPWRVDIGDRRYVIDSAAPAEALRRILPRLRRDELRVLLDEATHPQ